MTDLVDRSARTPNARLAHIAWFVLAVLTLRIVYLAFLSPWRLVADEAQYWEWSRRLDWSYYTKGPGVAWVIWASTRLFGDHEWSVRLPSALASAIMTWTGARLAYDVAAESDAPERASAAAWFAAMALAIAPGFFTTAQLLTPDMFYSCAWLLGARCALRAVRASSSTASIVAWLGVGAAVGVGFLFKYTAFLFVPGLIAWLIATRRDRASGPVVVGLCVASIAFLVVASPVAIWNAQRGWPTIAHQLGRVHLPGGDETVKWNWSPVWFVSFVGQQVGILGLFGAFLIAMGVRQTARGVDRVGRSLLIWLAVPIVVGYVLLSVFREMQGNWAIAGYTTPLVLVGVAVARAPVSRLEPIRAAWSWFVGVGMVVAIVILFGPWVFRLPVVNSINRVQRLARHIGGSTQLVVDQVQTERARFTRPPVLICNSYQYASLLGFYLPDRPLIYVARHLMGGRPTPWDYFADTDLHDPSLIGRDVLLIGSNRGAWTRTFNCTSIDIIPGTGGDGAPSLFRLTNFRGARAPTTQPASNPSGNPSDKPSEKSSDDDDA